ncbi:MAG: OadG family protein [Clostridia bacterium]|nr:OadG family protein [Clostridia bacterium]
MKNLKKSGIFVILFLVFCMVFSTVAYASGDVGEAPESAASGKLDQDMSGADMSFGERLEYALQGTVTGLLMVFAVLGLLYGIVSLSKVVFYDIPENKKKKKQKAHAPVEVSVPAPTSAAAAEESAVEDDGELIAVITAAVAAMIESGDYKNEFAGGFRVVSFKRSAKSAWNRK